MIKRHFQKNIINRKSCICKSKLKQKINFGDLPLINNYKVRKNLKKYPTIISQCKNCLLIQLKYSVPDYIKKNSEIMKKILKIDLDAVKSPSKGNFDIILKSKKK